MGDARMEMKRHPRIAIWMSLLHRGEMNEDREMNEISLLQQYLLVRGECTGTTANLVPRIVGVEVGKERREREHERPFQEKNQDPERDLAEKPAAQLCTLNGEWVGSSTTY